MMRRRQQRASSRSDRQLLLAPGPKLQARAFELTSRSETAPRMRCNSGQLFNGTFNELFLFLFLPASELLLASVAAG